MLTRAVCCWELTSITTVVITTTTIVTTITIVIVSSSSIVFTATIFTIGDGMASDAA